MASSLPVTLKKNNLNPVVEIWAQFRRHFNLTQMIGLTPLTFNHLFPPSQLDLTFKVWHSRGIVFFVDLFDDSSFKPFDFLCQVHNIPQNHYLHYLRAHSFASKCFPSFPHPPDKSPAQAMLKLNPCNKGIVSKIYGMIQKLNVLTWNCTRMAWELDLGEPISDEQWDSAISLINSSSFCVRLNLIQFEVFHWLHYSNDKLAKIYPSVCPDCPRCLCTVLQSLWDICSGPVHP